MSPWDFYFSKIVLSLSGYCQETQWSFNSESTRVPFPVYLASPTVLLTCYSVDTVSELYACDYPTMYLVPPLNETKSL